MNTRSEHDLIGELFLEENSYYGIHTARAMENFAQDGPRCHFEIIQAISLIKKAAAKVNAELGFLNQEKSQWIQDAADQIIAGEWRDQFPLPAIQGGAGTSLHMNVNEVIANLALEKANHVKGDYEYIHPNDDINRFQSTNDVYPSAVKIAAIRLMLELAEELSRLQSTLQEKETEFAGVIKTGRTQLQDAMPVTLGQEFGAWSEAVARDRWRVYKAEERLRSVNIGGTAIGTGTGAPKVFIYKLTEQIQQMTRLGISRAENTIDATQNMDMFVEVSGILKAVAVNFIKISSDIRLLSSGPHSGIGEINLPPRQAGSSLMPGKINPVIPEFAAQAGMQVIALDGGITQAAALGQLELNAFLPLIAHNLLQSIKLLRDASRSFREYCIQGITANAEHARDLLEHSDVLITLLLPYTGYEKAGEIIKAARSQNIPIRQYLEKQKLFSKEELAILFDSNSATSPGISGSEELKNRLKLKDS